MPLTRISPVVEVRPRPPVDPESRVALEENSVTPASEVIVCSLIEIVDEDESGVDVAVVGRFRAVTRPRLPMVSADVEPVRLPMVRVPEWPLIVNLPLANEAVTPVRPSPPDPVAAANWLLMEFTTSSMVLEELTLIVVVFVPLKMVNPVASDETPALAKVDVLSAVVDVPAVARLVMVKKFEESFGLPKITLLDEGATKLNLPSLMLLDTPPPEIRSLLRVSWMAWRTPPTVSVALMVRVFDVTTPVVVFRTPMVIVPEPEVRFPPGMSETVVASLTAAPITPPLVREERVANWLVLIVKDWREVFAPAVAVATAVLVEVAVRTWVAVESIRVDVADLRELSFVEISVRSVLRFCKVACWFCILTSGRFSIDINWLTMALVSRPDARPPNENMGLVEDPLEFVVVVIGELVMLEVPFRNIGPAGNGIRPAMDRAAKPVPDNVVP